MTETDALGRSLSYHYDQSGNLTGQTDADGNLITYSYDPNGNLLEIIHPNGNLTSGSAQNHSKTTHSYDKLNRLTAQTLPSAHAWHETVHHRTCTVSHGRQHKSLCPGAEQEKYCHKDPRSTMASKETA